jgi:hypothetical protein
LVPNPANFLYTDRNGNPVQNTSGKGATSSKGGSASGKGGGAAGNGTGTGTQSAGSYDVLKIPQTYDNNTTMGQLFNDATKKHYVSNAQYDDLLAMAP